MAENISIGIGLEGGEDVSKTLEKIVGDVDSVKTAAEELGQVDATVKVKAEGADETKAAIDGVKTAAEELGQVDATVKFGDTAQGANKAKSALDPLSQSATILSAGIDAMQLKLHRAEAAFETLGEAALRMGSRMTKSLGLLGVAARAFGPIGIAAGVVGGAFVKMGNDATASMQAISAEATKLGKPVEQLKAQLAALQQSGVSPDAAIEGLKKLGEAAADAKLENLKTAADEIKKFGLSVISGVGGFEIMPRQIKDLTEAAKGVGPAADFARKRLEELGLVAARKIEFGMTIPPGMVLTLQQLITVTGSADRGLEAFKQQLQSMPDGIDRTNLAMQGMGQAGLEFVQALRLAQGSMGPAEAAAESYRQQVNALSAQWTKFKDETGTPVMSVVITSLSEAIKVAEAFVSTFRMIGSVINSVAQVGAGVIGALAAPIQLVITEVQRLASTFAGWNWDPIAAGVQVWNDITAAIGPSAAAVGDFISKMAGIVWDAISGAGVAAWNALTGAIQGAIDKLLQFFGLKDKGGGAVVAGGAPIGGAGGGIGSKARGGLLGGRGTGTSDSNLAWLSRGEYITPARAVAQPGVLAFLEALRRSGGNLSRVLDGMGRFALGGMVPRMPAMAFAGGGMVGGGNLGTLTLGLPSGGSVTVRASSSVAEQLRQEAALAQVRSGGRKPSRYS